VNSLYTRWRRVAATPRGRVLQALVGSLLVLAAGACAHILGIREVPRSFEHRAHVLEGIPCVRCHAVEEAGEIGELHLPDNASCGECHEDPHDPRPCLDCHTDPVARGRAADNKQHILFRHDLHLQRKPGECVRCHTGIAGRADSLAAPMAGCFGCHAHADQFQVGKCDDCHVDLHTEGSAPMTHLVHDLDFERRHGIQASSSSEVCSSCHRDRFCASCHGVTVPALPSRLALHDPSTPSVHRAGFLSRHSNEARTQTGLCSTCHAPSFCGDCHQDRGIGAGAGGASPHSRNWLERHGPEARRDPMACASCHGGAGEALCVGCHKVGGAGGSVHPAGWSSRKQRTDQPCRRCHVP
jgi:hypothetical protein